MKGAVLALGMFLSTHVLQAEEVTMENWVIERAEARYQLGETRTLELINKFGDVRVRASDTNEIATYSVIQHHQDDAQKPSLVSRVEDGRLILEVSYPPASPDSPIPGADKRRLDLSAFVPPSLNLKIETDQGLVESKGHKGNLHITSHSGDIGIKTKGNVTAFTGTGNIQAYHDSRDWTGSSGYQTDTGNISVFLLSDPNIQANIQTAGEIATDYTMTISHRPGSSTKEGVSLIGTPNNQLNLMSKNGKVALVRIPGMIHLERPQPEAGLTAN